MVGHRDVVHGILERAERERVGRVGGDILRAELGLRDPHIAQIGIHRHIGRGDVANLVDDGLANLTLDTEVTLDGLLGRDGPLVVLIHRQGDIHGLAQVEDSGKGGIALRARGHLNGSDVDLADIRSLLQVELDGVGRSIDLGRGLQSVGL